MCRGDPRRVIPGKSKWRVKLARPPGGGEQAGECGQEHEAGQESRGGREAVRAEEPEGGARPPAAPPAGRSRPGRGGPRAGGLAGRRLRALPANPHTYFPG